MAHQSAMHECIQDCRDCHDTCLETLAYCLQKGGKHAEMEHIRLLLDCSQICQTSADFMLRGSNFHARTCAVCAEVCDQCMRDCQQLGDDARMKQCADTCRRCAESCRKMASARLAA
jgi:hypothetical protein